MNSRNKIFNTNENKVKSIIFLFLQGTFITKNIVTWQLTK